MKHLVPVSFTLFAILLTILAHLSSIPVPANALKLSSLGSWFANDASSNDTPSDGRRSSDSHPDVCSFASCPSSTSSSYGVDTSFPTHHRDIKEDNNPFNVESMRQYYKDFVEGCKSEYSPKGYLCTGTEKERVDMNLNQPPSMFNYTSLGFYKTRAPPKLMSLLTKFWNDNTSPSTINSIPNEEWPAGNTYTNHWASPTKMLNLQDTTLIGSGDALRKKIWDETQQILQEWTGVDLSPTSLYGVRIYTSGAVLAPHVDRNPLVISAIINVAQNVEEDWPLEVIGHDGRAYNVTMEVGDMILYESHSVIHGRPFKLKGEYFANVFCHFEPLGHSLREGQRAVSGHEGGSLEYLYREAWEKQRQQKQDGDFSIDLNADEMMTPYYIVPGSLEEKRWIQSHPRARMQEENKKTMPNLTAHAAAAEGDMASLLAIAAKDPNAIKKVDNNGWTPLHEAVRGGHVDVASYLLSNGLDVNHRTHGGTGGSPLWWAKKTHGENHPIVTYLKNNGAKEIAPDKD